MRITVKEEVPNMVTINDIPPGKCFVYNDELYLRTTVGAVSVDTGTTHTSAAFGAVRIVTPVKAHVVLGED